MLLCRCKEFINEFSVVKLWKKQKWKYFQAWNTNKNIVNESHIKKGKWLMVDVDNFDKNEFKIC